ncbi:MAG: hypothetical protein DRQ57_08145 [Gammaproteobacteria bacterium]|nr:MAG: hypothetical protein DRQ57_08145 [Gammaproteobacteria bacterium]
MRNVDIYFMPKKTVNRQELGLLAQMTSKACLLEPFRNQPSKLEIRQCLLKLFSVHEEALPRLWIITTSASDNLLNFFEARLKPTWGKGVYFLNQGLRSAIVVVDRLPITKKTLWLRILGKGQTQEQAIDEVTALPRGNILRNHVLELLSTWHINIETKKKLTKDEKELLMNLSRAYLKWREETLLQGLRDGLQEGLQKGVQQGVQQGHLEERHSVIENMLKLRFGVDETLSQVIEPLVQMPQEESLRLLMQASRDKLLERLGKQA